MVIKPKGLSRFLEEDPSLAETYTYDEYQKGLAAPVNTDVTIEEAYKSYCEKRAKLEKRVN